MSDQPHDHAHDHHGHDHTHDGDTYFLDQLCMVGLSAAFGVICLCLYVGKLRQTEGGSMPMLNLLLGEQFHPFVLASGVALVLVAGVRAFSLWRQAGRPALPHDHDHDHEHCAHAPGEACEHVQAGTPVHEHV